MTKKLKVGTYVFRKWGNVGLWNYCHLYPMQIKEIKSDWCITHSEGNKFFGRDEDCTFYITESGYRYHEKELTTLDSVAKSTERKINKMTEELKVLKKFQLGEK